MRFHLLIKVQGNIQMLFVQAYVQIEKEYKKDNRRINVMSTGELESTGKEQDYKS